MTILFDEPFDWGVIDTALADEQFYSIAYVKLGVRKAWDRGLSEYGRLIDAHEEAGRDGLNVWKLATVFIKRTHDFDDTGEMLKQVETRLRILPGTAWFNEIAMANLHKTDPQAWMKRQHREWATNYAKLRGGTALPPSTWR